MRVIYLAAGAAGMFCGSCLRDNRVVVTLRELGRDVRLVPLYTPLRTDEPSAAGDPVCFGGINTFLQQHFALFRALPAPLDRWLSHPRLLRVVDGFAGATRPERLGDLTVSILRGPNGRQRKELNQLIAALRPLRPAVVNIPNLLLAGLARPLREALGCAVVCTLSGEDLFIDGLSPAARREAISLIRSAAPAIDSFIAVTRYFAAHAADLFGLPADRVEYVPMGIRLSDFARRAAAPDGPLTLGYLARVCRAKGLHHAISALIALRRQGVEARLRAAGYLAPGDRAWLRQELDRLRAAGCSDQFEYLGEVDRAGKAAFLRSLHALVALPEYAEAKGLYVLEALAAAVPVIGFAHGALVELIRDTGGGMLARPAEIPDVTDAALRLRDPVLNASLGDAGQAAVARLHSDRRMAECTWSVYERAVQTCDSSAGTVTA